MSDEDLRELERRWREGPKVELAYQRALLRSGQLESERAELVAHLDAEDGDVLLWFKRLRSHGREAMKRAAVAAAGLALEATSANPEWATHLNATRQLVVERSPELERQARDTYALARALADIAPGDRDAAAVRAIGRAAMCAVYARAGEVQRQGLRALRASRAAVSTTGTEAPDRELRARIRRELAPWAFGYADPLRELT